MRKEGLLILFHLSLSFTCFIGFIISLILFIHPLIYLSISCHLSRSRSRWQRAMQSSPDLLIHGYFLRLFQEDPEVFPGQMGNINAPLPSGTFPAGCAWITSIGRRPEGILIRCPSHWPTGSSQQQGAVDLLCIPQLLTWSQRYEPCHTVEDTHFGRLYPRSFSFHRHPNLKMTGECWNVDWAVSWELCFHAQLPPHRDSPASRQCRTKAPDNLTLHFTPPCELPKTQTYLNSQHLSLSSNVNHNEPSKFYLAHLHSGWAQSLNNTGFKALD